VPDCPAVVFAIVRRLDGVVDGHNDRQQPARQRQHLVPDDRVGAVRVPLREGVDWTCQRRKGKFSIHRGHTLMEAIHFGGSL
jgi:hypothetical protein